MLRLWIFNKYNLDTGSNAISEDGHIVNVDHDESKIKLSNID